MEIPTQLREAIASLAPDESNEIQHFVEGLPSDDAELENLINENLDSLINVLKDESENFLIAC